MKPVKSFGSSVRQRAVISTGVSPDISIARLIVPPEVPSAWWKHSSASANACKTPAWYATRIPPPARINDRFGPA